VNARVLVVGLIAISVLTVAASIYFRSTVVPFDKSFSAVPSPNGRFKAVRLAVTRKTPPPYCEASVSIFLAIYPDNFAETEREYRVYDAPCPLPPDPANLPAVAWLADDAVQVTYTPGPPATDVSKLRRWSVDASRAVRVSYVEREKP
jgi:hypothetical protein